MTSNCKTSTSKTKFQIWRRRTLMERYLITICLLMTVALIVLIGVLLYLIYSSRRPSMPVCHSNMCRRKAGRIMSYMNVSTDPCEDFYTFSCGSFIKDNRVPPNSELLDLDILAEEDLNWLSKELIEAISDEEEQGYLKKVKTFYQSCLDRSTDTADIINSYLSKTGLRVWPILDNEVLDISKILATVHIYGMSNPFYGFGRSYIPGNSTKGKEMSTYFYDMGSISVDTETLTKLAEEEFIKSKEIYKRNLSYALHKANVPFNVIESEADNIIAFETKLAQVIEDFENDTSGANLVETTLKDFLIDCDKISFLDSVRYIYEYLGHAEDFSEEMSTNVYKTGYLERVCELVKTTDHRTLHNYLVWYFLVRKLRQFDPYFTSPYDYEKEIRWRKCIETALRSRFQLGVAYLLLNYLRAEERVKEVKEYVLEIKKSMEHMLSTESWIGPVIRNRSIHKMRNIEVYLGYCKDSFNLTAIESYFSMINVTDNYFEHDLEHMKTLFKKELFNYTYPLNRDMVIGSSFLPSAYYFNEEIYVHLGYLIPPYFIPNGPKFLNYGAIGFTIAHELSHAFEEHDELLNDNETENWPNETIQAYIQRKQCIMNQYSKYPLDENGTMVNTRRTSADDISDNSGVFQSFAAYENYLKSNGEEPQLPGLDYTNQQMYFISYAQQWCEVVKSVVETYKGDFHSPSKYRVNGPLQNFPKFSEAFSCPADSPMNPLHKCRLYG